MFPYIGSSGSSENLTVLLLESDSVEAEAISLLGFSGVFFPQV